MTMVRREIDAAEFDVFGCSLDGINLIEASAGTGKTWNICGLYLRLLLERGLEVQRILVVTFTNAATAELRERVRSRIVETLNYLRDEDAAPPGGDPFVAALVRAVEARTGRARAQLALTLDQALHHFDEAAIATIHGFCQRALAEAAFSVGLPFSLELVADDAEVTLAAVRDFWRRRVAGNGCPPPLAEHLLQRGDTPESFAALLARSLAKPLAKCRWPAVLDAAEAPIDTTATLAVHAAAARVWADHRAALVALLRDSVAALNKSSYKEAAIDRAAGAWDAYFRDGTALAPLDRDAKPELFAAATLAARTLKGRAPPSHPFFAHAQALLDARAALDGTLGLARLRLLREMLDTASLDVRARKRERRVIAFDDILYNLYEALERDAHAELAVALRAKFPVALIDEFQDTDPLQFAIFDRLYRQGAAPAFLVGDPKQAIYSFRNADLHAYLRARETASARHTLADNQRSTRGLIAALNGLFAANPRAFVLPGLDYHPVRLGAKPRKLFSDASAPRADLQVWMLPQSADGQAIKRADAKTLAAQATAAEIARLIAAGADGRIEIDGRGLRPGDIAVLVRTHAQGSALKRALAVLDVGSVELSPASVFASVDAEEVERVLIAIDEPTHDRLLRGALATEMIGCDAARIAALCADEAQLAGYLVRYAEYRELWLRRGFGVMYRRLLSDERVGARMLCRPDGERRLTNLLHLGELLHQAGTVHAAPDALLRWLAAQRRDAAAGEAAQLRLESDRNLVRIVTVHKAKGLEFPIVFCPFLWEGRVRFGGPRPEGREYHDRSGAAVIDFRDDEALSDEAQPIADSMKLEAAAEALRLIYVALTRAIHRCYLVAGTYATTSFGRLSTRESTRSLLNWLVAGADETPLKWIEGERTPAAIEAAWQALASEHAPYLALARMPLGAGVPVALPAPTPELLAALPPPSSIPPAWRFGSFSALAGGAQSERAANDRDAYAGTLTRDPGAPPEHVAADDILRFPRGASAGACVHAIFERSDFTEPASWDDAVAYALSTHPQILRDVPAGEQPSRLARMAKSMLAQVLAAPLPNGIVLGRVPAGRRLVELEFSLPAGRVSAGALNAALKRLGYVVPRLVFQDLEGYLKGFIDLVFEHDGRYYVLDWKSNHLGYAASDYGPDALNAAMAEHGYALQYLLYSLAVSRYLARRVQGYSYEAHFGGVLYLFVRGVRSGWTDGAGRPAGVFHHKPPAAALAALQDLFGRVSAQATP